MSEDGPDYLIAEAKKFADEAERQLNIMENDLRSMASNESAQLQKKFLNCKENLGQLKSSLLSAREKKDKDALIGSGTNNTREKMLTNNQILQETGDILENTHKIAIESEGLGFDALNELKGQRRKINIIGEKVQDVGTNITKANRIIKTMDNRRICMKIVMMATILLLIIALAICLYIKIG